MPDYMASLTSDLDGAVHVYRSDEAEHSLCGKPRGENVPSPKGRPVCDKCAKRLLIRIFESRDRLGSFDITVH